MASEHRENVKVVNADGYQRREKVVEVGPSTQNIVLSRINQLLWFAVSTVNILLGLRVLFKLIVANPNNQFANLLYEVTWLFAAPFSTIIANPVFDNGSVLEITTIIAMVVYGIAVLLITMLLNILFKDTDSRSVRTVERS